MSESLDALLEIICVEQLDTLLFRGFTPAGRNRRVYGGQVLAQAMNAATRTVDATRRIHSLPAYFLRPGDPQAAIIYDVDPVRDGGSYTTRRVVARQHGKAICIIAMSYQLPETGLEHAAEMPAVDPPEKVESDFDYFSRLAELQPEHYRPPRQRAIDYRPVERIDYLSPHPATDRCGVWMRANGKLPDEAGIHEAILAYMSDQYLMSTALRPHGMLFHDRRLLTASLDHALWFYADSRADDWHYFDLASPRAARGRGFNHGWIYTRDGCLVATCVQEGMMRLREKPADS